MRRDDALLLEHFGVGAACGDVLAKQLAVNLNGGVYIGHDGVGSAIKAAAPHLVAHGGTIGVAAETVKVMTDHSAYPPPDDPSPQGGAGGGWGDRGARHPGGGIRRRRRFAQRWRTRLPVRPRPCAADGTARP